MDNDGAIRRYAGEAQEMAADPGMRRSGIMASYCPALSKDAFATKVVCRNPFGKRCQDAGRWAGSFQRLVLSSSPFSRSQFQS